MSTKTNDPKQTAPETAPAAEDVKADTAAKTEETEEAPVKKASDEKDMCRKPTCCGNACGTDPMSKLAEAVADKKQPRG